MIQCNNSNNNEIEVNNSLRSKLFRLYNETLEKNGRSNREQTKEANNDTKKSDNHKNNQSVSFILRNPQTLLSHEPRQLCYMLDLSMNEVMKLRNQVSNGIVADSTIGNAIPFIFQNHENIQNTTRTNNNANEKNENIQNNDGYHERMKTNTLMQGCCMTAKDLYNASLLSSRLNPTSSNNLETGSKALDELIYSSSLPLSTKEGVYIGSKRKRQDVQNDQYYLSNLGIPIGTITEICGPSSSGKTQLALSIAANAIMSNHTHGNDKYKKCVVYYIAGGGGSTSLLSLARRFRQLCRSRLNENSRENSSTTNNIHKDKVLESINFIPVGDNPYHLLAELNSIERKMKDDSSESNVMIIIDSISGCLSSFLYADGDGGVGVGLMNEISITIRRISRLIVYYDINGTQIANQCAIIMTNGMVTGNKPALGDSWRAADVRVTLNRMHHYESKFENVSNKVQGLKTTFMTVHCAKLDKHFAKCVRSSASVIFAIDQSGVVNFVS